MAIWFMPMVKSIKFHLEKDLYLNVKIRKMKKISSILVLILLFFSCDQHLIDKPDNLIEEEKMELILYDIAVLEAIKASNPNGLTVMGIDENTYILKKHKIDSLQFSKSNKYYASDLHSYLKMYERIELKLTNEKNATDTLVKKGINLNTKIVVDTTNQSKIKKKKMVRIN